MKFGTRFLSALLVVLSLQGAAFAGNALQCTTSGDALDSVIVRDKAVDVMFMSGEMATYSYASTLSGIKSWLKKGKPVGVTLTSESSAYHGGGMTDAGLLYMASLSSAKLAINGILYVMECRDYTLLHE